MLGAIALVFGIKWERFLAWLRNEQQHQYTHPSLRKSVIVTRPAPLSTNPYLGPKRSRPIKRR